MRSLTWWPAYAEIVTVYELAAQAFGESDNRRLGVSRLNLWRESHDRSSRHLQLAQRRRMARQCKAPHSPGHAANARLSGRLLAPRPGHWKGGFNLLLREL